MVDPDSVIAILAERMPHVLRWAGAVATQLRGHDISLGGKQSGFSNTDALTLADLALQELLVAAVRDAHPLLRRCRIEAEESVGDLSAFDARSELVIALDPIDGTKQFRDRSGAGWSVMLHVRTATDVLYSLVYHPAIEPQGRWVEVRGDACRVGEDDWSRPARQVLDGLSDSKPSHESKRIYLIGFVGREQESASAVTAVGLTGVDADSAESSIYDLMARGEYAGSLIHSPNVYDYPVSVQIARRRGGDSIFVRGGRPVDFRDLWLDRKSGMWRLKGVVATASDPAVLAKLRAVAEDWNEDRYAGTN